jgi:predicted metal-dependent hydrolase
MPVHISRLIRSKRRTIALVVERDGSVTVRAPLRMSAKDIEEFVGKHSNWVKKKQLELQSRTPAQPREFKAGEHFLYLGRTYRLEFSQNTKHKLILDETFQLSITQKENAEMLFREWYRKQAARHIPERVTHFAEQFDLKVEKVRITSARTRWGSCSPKGTLSLSWRLMMTPPDVIDYVVIHELAHTVHHNHSTRFWKLVERWLPDYKERRRQLRRYAQESI